jgi:TPP-dependent indolepyruvate ferredoxin oxidoreductase alpha subunit
LFSNLAVIYRVYTDFCEIEEKLKEETEAKQKLQTKYDLEVKSKEEVVKELRESERREKKLEKDILKMIDNNPINIQKAK